MAMSKSAKKAYKKALKAKKKAKRGHWLLIQKGDSIKEVLSKLFTQFAVLVLIACGLILANEFRLSFSAKQLNDSLKSLYQSVISHTSDGQILAGAQEMLKINPDTVGYICIEGTEVDFPVVQTDNNEEYLKTSFNGNQKDRTMFGSLKDYKKNLNHYIQHPTITFNSNYRSDVYKIFAYFVTEVKPEQTSDGVVFDYHNYLDLSDKAVYNEFIENITERSQIVTSVDVKYGDEFLTLSTCSNEFEPSRFVIFARKTRKGEDPSVDTSTAYLNPNAKEPDWTVIFK